MIIDASALMTLVFLEPDRPLYEDAIFASEDELLISPLNLWEAFAVAERSEDPAHRASFLRIEDALQMIVVPTDTAQLSVARDAWRVYGKGSGHKAGLNFGDCFAYALAKTRDEPLLFKGDDFVHTDIRSAL